MSLKTTRKLKEKKYRKETGEFIVEGKKNILELLDSSFEVIRIYATLDAGEAFEDALDVYAKRVDCPRPELHIVSEEKLLAMGTLHSNNAGVAIARAKISITSDEVLERAKDELILVLDDVRDPGNLGTIIRTADWFGISLIVVSSTTVDALNPKVIASSMGSFTRVEVVTLSLDIFLGDAQKQDLPILGAFLDGMNSNELTSHNHGILVMGSESHGISEDLRKFIKTKVTIPRYGKAESLNVATATAVILAALRR